jgi:AcrR family transcriptional regulator
MGRPREHNARTAASLLVAAERIVEEGGPDALSVRGVAGEVGTTTRAVYSLYGSKEGLIDALAAHGFEVLRTGIEELPTTAHPDRDLIRCGLVFRRYAVEHPSLFRIAFGTAPSPMSSAPATREAAASSLQALKQRITRLGEAGLLAGRSVDEATLQFHAVCEGLAGLELRGQMPHDAQRQWRGALSALVNGLAG